MDRLAPQREARAGVSMNADAILARTIREGDCQIWQGAVQSSGYGSVSSGVRSRSLLAHRVVFTEMVGPIEEGMTVDHLCSNKLCQNVFHMELVTRGENSRRKHERQTHCLKGHLLSGENLRTSMKHDGHERRVCMTCHREHTAAYRARLKERAA